VACSPGVPTLASTTPLTGAVLAEIPQCTGDDVIAAVANARHAQVVWAATPVRVRAAVLRHSIPCLGFALTERFHVNIHTTGLKALGLAPGPWIARFKRALYAGADRQTEFRIPPAPSGSERTFVLGSLAEEIARITPGQKIAYIADVGDGPDTRTAVAALARDADQLFIEAAFLDSERDRAAATHHLTARQAGELAALAGARRFTLFHFSPRYEGREAELREEARQSYLQMAARAGGKMGTLA
jgi:ribonuclease Z